MTENLDHPEHDLIPYETIPEQFRGGIQRYIQYGTAPGHFLTAVLENNLTEVINRADANALDSLATIVRWLYNEAPGGSWGSPEAVKKMIRQGGYVF